MKDANGIASQKCTRSKSQVNVQAGIHGAIICDYHPTQVDEARLHRDASRGIFRDGSWVADKGLSTALST
jgi:hypothetical protein